jgi:phage regulator Rha-like protein
VIGALSEIRIAKVREKRHHFLRREIGNLIEIVECLIPGGQQDRELFVCLRQVVASNDILC